MIFQVSRRLLYSSVSVVGFRIVSLGVPVLAYLGCGVEELSFRFRWVRKLLRRNPASSALQHPLLPRDNGIGIFTGPGPGKSGNYQSYSGHSGFICRAYLTPLTLNPEPSIRNGRSMPTLLAGSSKYNCRLLPHLYNILFGGAEIPTP